MLFWYCLIFLKATSPGKYLWEILILWVLGAYLLSFPELSTFFFSDLPIFFILKQPITLPSLPLLCFSGNHPNENASSSHLHAVLLLWAIVGEWEKSCCVYRVIKHLYKTVYSVWLIEVEPTKQLLCWSTTQISMMSFCQLIHSFSLDSIYTVLYPYLYLVKYNVVLWSIILYMIRNLQYNIVYFFKKICTSCISVLNWKETLYVT